MFIKSIILDGFKSYGTRTEINGFDPEFNAITGLNGTGKSNILDSICFVLGISNISLVRAGSLQDLIYKSGQAGVTKASVTVVFDNTDTSKSPINYEQCKEITVCRQIVVGGKNRYMINGVATATKQVQDFFNGIQLNVNNPHFLIMQGRITKVLNMKPPEILSMIEEAAGTRMYENKKHDAQRTIEKKDGRLKEINEMVSEQINPKLQKMKDEKDLYNEYSKIVRDLDIYIRITAAWQYLQTEASLKKYEERLEEVKNHQKGLHENIATKKTRIKELEDEVAEIQTILDKESGGELQELEMALKESEKVEAKDSALVKSAKETISASTKHLKQLQKSVDDDEKALAQKQAELGKLQSFFENLKEACEQDAEAFAAAQRKLQAVSSGLLENDDGDNATLQDQLMTAKQIVTEHETEIKKSMLKIQQDKKELDSKKPLLKKTEMAFANDKKDLDLKEKELKGLRENLSKCNYQEGHLENLQGRYRELHSGYRDRCEVVNNFSHRFPYLNFQYTDPEPNFDRRKVRGLLCKLFKIKDEKFARALESAAGGKLYNVVVDNEVISAKLIEKGRLTKRTTFAPLNKIQGYKMDMGTVKRAQSEYGADNVFLAQSLIEYSPEYESVMSWTFGQTLICSNIDVAEQICSRLKKKTITLDGDVFDPAGVISGGAVEKSQPVLLALIEFKKAEGALSEIKKEMDSVNEEIKRITPIASNYESMRERAEVCSREVEMVRARLEQTSHFQLQTELKSLQDAIDENEAKIQQCKKEVKEKSVKVKELEDKMKNMHAIKEKALAAAEAEVKKAKKKADDSRNKWKQREQEFETLTLETQELQKSLQNGKDQIAKAEETLAQNQEELKVKTEELKAKSEIVKEKKAAVLVKKEEIGVKNSEIQKRQSEKTTLEKAISRGELDIIGLGHSMDKIKTDISEAKQIMANLVKKYRWIETERQYFGTPAGKYDFSNYNPPELIEQIPRLQERKDKIAKSINVKAIDAMGNKEEGFHDVMNKKEIIEEDRSKILSVIEELDVKKEEVIRRAWDKVNHDFHSILSSLLPSAHAKLKPVDGKDFMHGLEVKVGFGGIWKDSLDELSGGQRSLVALSLILAMLLFKPAPLYILDEVDAALDPSHTQNIGQMLKTHFKQSQFIVVSLKDGMFNNANVLFRTAFVDGMSTVIRTTTNTGKK